MCSADCRAVPELQEHIHWICAVRIAGLCLSCRCTFTEYVQCGLQGCAWAAGAYLRGVCSVDCRAVPGLQADIYQVCAMWISRLRDEAASSCPAQGLGRGKHQRPWASFPAWAVPPAITSQQDGRQGICRLCAPASRPVWERSSISIPHSG